MPLKLIVALTSGLLLAGCATGPNTPSAVREQLDQPSHNDQHPQTATALPSIEADSHFSDKAPQHKEDETNQEVQQEPTTVWDMLGQGNLFSSDIENGRIDKHLAHHLKDPHALEQTLKQAEAYLPYVATQVEQNGLPMELALIPFIESAYDPFAVSSSKATGLWQFIPDTGRRMGLEENQWYNGRRDIVDSTDAAIRYFKRLNQQFDGDWLLSLAAYNAGPGNVRRAIRHNEREGLPTDFWHLDLPAQTKSYVPKLLALSRILSEPDKYELEPPLIYQESTFSIVPVTRSLDLNTAASLTNLNPEDLIKLNPGLNHDYLPVNIVDRILLPAESASLFIDQLAASPTRDPELASLYKVEPGDTLSAIASKFNTEIATIQNTNGLTSTRIRTGQTLKIPGRGFSAAPNSANHYRVKSGDNLWLIAKQQGTSVKKLREWNQLGAASVLQPGDTLIVSRPQFISYEIRAGESIEDIAKRLNVKLDDLLTWNNLEDNATVAPGQQLRVFNQ